MNLDILKTELTADPLGRGYAVMSDQQAADSLNDLIDRTRPRGSMSGDEVFAATNAADFEGLGGNNAEDKRTQWLAFCGRDSIDPFGAANVAFVEYIFGNPSATRTALIAARQRAVSRGVELGLGIVRPGNVAEARRLP